MATGQTENPLAEVPVSSGSLSPGPLPAESVSALYQQYASDLLAFLQGLLRDAESAREALQSTFQRVLEAGHTARPDSMKGWLFKVAYHEALQLRRKASTHERAIKTWGEQNAPAAGHGPQELIVTAEDVERLKHALKELPNEQRDVVERRIYREQTFAMIAAELKVPLGTVLTRMRLALEKLQKRLQDREPPNDPTSTGLPRRAR